MGWHRLPTMKRTWIAFSSRPQHATRRSTIIRFRLVSPLGTRWLGAAQTVKPARKLAAEHEPSDRHHDTYREPLCGPVRVRTTP